MTDQSAADVVEVRARGLLTEDDYRQVLVPPLEQALQNAGRIRVLLFMDETFRGWTARGAWFNTCLDVRHRRHFAKVAIVGAPSWENWCAKLANVLISGQIRTFGRADLNAARVWLRA